MLRVEAPTYQPDRAIHPRAILSEQAANAPKNIKECWWYRPVEIAFDVDPKLSPSPLHRTFINDLGRSLLKKNQGVTFQPTNETTNMVIGFHDIPKGPATLMDRVLEIPPMIITAAHRYSRKINEDIPDQKRDPLDTMHKNYTAVVTLDEDITKMKKRDAETITRMLMTRLGALKIIMIHPNTEGDVEYYALGTMEGGLAIERSANPDAIDRFADRLITHSCAKDSGTYSGIPDVIDHDQWKNSPVPDYIANASRTLARFGYIDKPFDLHRVASKKRVTRINGLMGFSRQSESAIAAWDPNLDVPDEYKTSSTSGAIVSSKSGRFNVDKTLLNREDTLPVAIVPREGYKFGQEAHLALEGFDRYALGIKGKNDVAGPSIEFDEMSAAILNSGFVRVRRHNSGKGYVLDMENGDIVMPRVRAFVHMHQGIENILPQTMWTNNAQDLVEYIPPNLKDYPYPVGCGKDIMFACSTDAAQRSEGVKNLRSGVQIALFDALDHGTNALILTEPLPGTDYIPDDPFDAFLQLVDPRYGAVQLSSELEMV